MGFLIVNLVVRFLLRITLSVWEEKKDGAFRILFTLNISDGMEEDPHRQVIRDCEWSYPKGFICFISTSVVIILVEMGVKPMYP